MEPREPEPGSPPPYDPRLEMRGVQAGALVLAGIVIGGVATAVFHLLAGRWLGPDSYADLAALLALLGLITFPLAGAQLNVARGVAHARATGDHYEDQPYLPSPPRVDRIVVHARRSRSRLLRRGSVTSSTSTRTRS